MLRHVSFMSKARGAPFSPRALPIGCRGLIGVSCFFRAESGCGDTIYQQGISNAQMAPRTLGNTGGPLYVLSSTPSSSIFSLHRLHNRQARQLRLIMCVNDAPAGIHEKNCAICTIAGLLNETYSQIAGQLVIALGTNLSTTDKSNVARLFTDVGYPDDPDPGVRGQMDSMMRFLTKYKKAKDVDPFHYVPF